MILDKLSNDPSDFTSLHTGPRPCTKCGSKFRNPHRSVSGTPFPMPQNFLSSLAVSIGVQIDTGRQPTRDTLIPSMVLVAELKGPKS